MKFGFGVGALELFPREILLRCLTLLCFFQFAGLQNGWIKINSLNSVDVVSSVQSIGAVSQDIYLKAHPVQMGRSLRAFTGSFAQWVGSANAARTVTETIAPFVQDSASASLSASVAISTLDQPDFSASGRQVLTLKEEWLSPKRIQAEGQRTNFDSRAALSNAFNGKKSEWMRVKGTVTASRRINKKKTGPRVVYAANDDASGARAVHTTLFIG